MILEIDKAIASGTLSINQVLDKDYHRARDIHIKHPQASVYKAVKLQANSGAAVHTDSELDDHEAIAMPLIFEGDLDEIDW